MEQHSGMELILQKINRLSSLVCIQWIPGHIDIPGNKLADKTAKSAAARPGASRRMSYGSVCSHISRLSKDPPPTHLRVREVYGALSNKREESVRSRRDQPLLARLWSGHHRPLRITTTIPSVTCVGKNPKIWLIGTLAAPPPPPPSGFYLDQILGDWT